MHADDSVVIRNTKAIINLLRAFESVDKDIFVRISAYLNSERKLAAAVKMGFMLHGFVKGEDRLQVFHQDVMSFIYHIQQLADLLSQLPATVIDQATREKIVALQTVLANNEIGKAATVVQAALEDRQAKNLTGNIPAVDTKK